MLSELDIKKILLQGEKKDLLYLKECLNSGCDDIIDVAFEVCMGLFNNYEYDNSEIFAFFKKLNIVFSDLNGGKYNDRILKKYEDLVIFLGKNKGNERFIKACNRSMKKYEALEKEEPINYDVIKYLVFEVKDLRLISSMLYDNNSFIYEDSCSNLLVDVISYYLDNDDDDKYFEKLVKLLLIFKDSLINDGNKSVIYNILKNNKHNKDNKKKIKLLNTYLKFDMLEYFDADVRINLDNKAFEYEFDSFGRCDFTDQYVLSIDDKDALCLDDAFSLVKNQDGTYNLFIHITDIYDIIKDNMFLDYYAYDLGETIYLKDKTVSLFPRTVCNDWGSLLHNRKRNVVTFAVRLDSNFNFVGNKIDDYFKILRGVIINKARLSYLSVNDILIRGSKNKNLNLMLENLSVIANKFRCDSFNKYQYYQIENIKTASLGIEEPVESKYVGTYTGAVMVQEFMFLVNRLSPELFASHGMPYLFRVCDKETKQIVEEYRASLDKHAFMNNLSEENIQKIINFLHSTSPAKYSSEKGKHLGLGLDYYSHSTSPGRRYSDVFNQKLIYDLWFLQNTSLENLDLWNKRCEKTALHLNQRSEFNEALAVAYHRQYSKTKRK